MSTITTTTSSASPMSPTDRASRTRRQATLFFGGVAFVVFSSLITRRALKRRQKPIPIPSAALARTTLPFTPTFSPTPVPQPSGSTTLQLFSQASSKGGKKFPSPPPGYTTAETALQNAPYTGPTRVGATGVGATGAGAGAAAEAEAAAAEALNANGSILAVEALFLATINVLSWGIMTTTAALWYFDIATLEDMRQKLRGGLGVDGTGRSEQDAEEEMEEWIVSVLARKEEKELIREKVKGEERRETMKNERGRER